MAMNLMEHANHAISVAGNLWESAVSLGDFPWYVRFPAMLVAAALGTALIVTAAKAIRYAIVDGTERAKKWTQDASVILGQRIVESSANCLEGIGYLALLALRLLWMPARMILDEALGWLAVVQKRVELELRVRKEWRDHHRKEFASFREFRAAFENGQSGDAGHDGAHREEPKFEEEERLDPFVGACRLLGLKENGSFTKAEMEARYRKLMMAAHPDRNGGDSKRATALNVARQVILSTKGWKA